jgi:hypothetical protein
LCFEKLSNKIYQPFLEKIQKREIRIWGMDCFSGYYYDIDGVKAILEEHSRPESLSINWTKLRDFYFRKFVLVPCRGCPEYKDKLSVDEQYELMRMIDSISNYTQYLMFSKGTTVELEVIMQWVRNLNTAFSYVEYAGFINGAGANLTNRNRDTQMAENIDWIVKKFPEERFIVWCANFHGAKDISQTQYLADSLLYFNFQAMGETVHATSGDKMYSLAFTSLRHGRERKT